MHGAPVTPSTTCGSCTSPERTARRTSSVLARGGPHWTDGFAFSGSNDPDAVAWYGPRWSRARRMGVRLLGWRRGWRLLGRPRVRRPTRTHAVATKAPNQLGIYDMCGNVWEWCQDACVDDLEAV